MSKRRLVLYGPNGAEITHDPTNRHEVGRLNLSDLPNADAAAPLLVIVQEQCSLEQWHNIGQAVLPNWDDRDWRGAGKDVSR